MQSKNPLDANILIVAIAQEGSFSRAAKILHIGKPSLTRKVSTLEKRLGVALFHRTTRRVELTKAGRLFVQEATISLSHAERAWDLARYQAQIEHGPYRIGFSPYVHSAFLPLLNGLKPHTSTVDSGFDGVVLESANSLELVERVLRNRLHAALAVGPIVEEDLWVQPVGREGFSLCLPRNHSLAKKPVLDVRDLDGKMVFWMPRSSHPRFYGRVMRYIRSAGVQPLFREVKATTHALELAAQGLGIAMLPRSADRISHAGTVFKSLTDRYLGVETVLLMRHDQRHGHLKDFMDDLFSQLVALKIQIN